MKNQWEIQEGFIWLVKGIKYKETYINKETKEEVELCNVATLHTFLSDRKNLEFYVLTETEAEPTILSNKAEVEIVNYLNSMTELEDNVFILEMQDEYAKYTLVIKKPKVSYY